MKSSFAIALAVAATCAIAHPSSFAAGVPKGAKAIFDSGEGTTIAMASGSARPNLPARAEAYLRDAPVRTASDEPLRPYVGISYQIMQVTDDGRMYPVSRSRVFRNGERVKLFVRTNRPGYLTVLNVGPTGNTNVLYNDYVEPFRPVDVPRGNNLVFVGAAGRERLLFMLSNEPNPVGQTPGQGAGSMVAMNNAAGAPGMPTGGMPASGMPAGGMSGGMPGGGMPGGTVGDGGMTGMPAGYAGSAGQPYAPMPPQSYTPGSALPPDPYAPQQPYAGAPQQPYPSAGATPPYPGAGAMPAIPSTGYPAAPQGDPNLAFNTFVSTLNRISGAKDLVTEDTMQSRYSVISRRGAYRPVGVKDLVVESQGGVNYGVVPVSTMADGGILTLDVGLRHQ